MRNALLQPPLFTLTKNRKKQEEASLRISFSDCTTMEGWGGPLCPEWLSECGADRKVTESSAREDREVCDIEHASGWSLQRLCWWDRFEWWSEELSHVLFSTLRSALLKLSGTMPEACELTYEIGVYLPTSFFTVSKNVQAMFSCYLGFRIKSKNPWELCAD